MYIIKMYFRKGKTLAPGDVTFSRSSDSSSRVSHREGVSRPVLTHTEASSSSSSSGCVYIQKRSLYRNNKIREQASFLFVYFIYRINIIKRDSGRKKKKNQLNWIEPAHLTFSLTYKNIIYTSTILYINEKILNCWSVSLSCCSSFFLPPYIFCIASPSVQVFRLGERVFLVVG